MKNFVLISIFFTFGVLFSSCTQNQNKESFVDEKQNELFLQMQDRFNMAGITNMIDNYVLSTADKAALAAEGISIKDITVATSKIEYANGSVVYSFQQPDQSYLVVKVSDQKVVRNFSAFVHEDNNQINFEVKEFDNISSCAFNKATKALILDDNQIKVLAALAIDEDPCAALGSRRTGETFGDCFKRNWNNFCCDFTGCMAQIAFPYLVAAAIALTCTC